MKLITHMYTPGEAAIASGRSVENQRNDRRAGYDPSPKGHARYDAFGVSRLFARQQFSDRGIGPQKSIEFVDAISKGLENLLTLDPRAWVSESVEKARGRERMMIEGLPDPKMKAAMLLRLESASYVPHHFTHLALEASGASLREIGAADGIVVWPDGSHEVGKAIWERFGKLAPHDHRIEGVALVMLFAPMARLLASRLPRPFFDIEGA